MSLSTSTTSKSAPTSSPRPKARPQTETAAPTRSPRPMARPQSLQDGTSLSREAMESDTESRSTLPNLSAWADADVAHDNASLAEGLPENRVLRSQLAEADCLPTERFYEGIEDPRRRLDVLRGVGIEQMASDFEHRMDDPGCQRVVAGEDGWISPLEREQAENVAVRDPAARVFRDLEEAIVISRANDQSVAWPSIDAASFNRAIQ